MSDTNDLSLLGQGATKYPQKPEDAVLETFANRWPENDYVVELECPEFTSLCPKTGQPDFARITIAYMPDRRLIESKALKLYLFSFRNHGEFHEDVTNRIAHDLFRAMDSPKVLIVRGEFYPRGGISINPCVILPKIPPAYLAEQVIAHLNRRHV
jgi:7-cyano-7-deazaguanine reductase